MEIKDRIRMIMEREKVPPKVFAKTIGVQQSTLSHILNGRNKPSLDVIMKVHQKYDYVNLEWLLYGEGEMMVSEEETSFSSSNSDYLPSFIRRESHKFVQRAGYSGKSQGNAIKKR